jgi:hypothetical protein
MGWLQRIFGGGAGRSESDSSSEPFMEHPTGEFATAIEAMEDAVRRLRALAPRERWISFSAQGAGQDADSYEFAEIRMLGHQLDVGETPLDVARIVQTAGVGASALVRDGEQYSVAGASPREVAQILDAIFRDHCGLRPQADEDDDYAVGAEW